MNVHDVGGRRRHEDNELTLRIYPGNIAEGTIYCPVTARKNTSAAEVIEILINKLHLDKTKCYVLAEVKEFGGEEWILNPTDCPVQRVMLWPRNALENRFSSEDYRFLLREKNLDGSIHYSNLQSWLKVTEERRRMMERGFLPQPQQKDYDDLCNLPDLNEKTLLDNLRNRFKQEKIYTYVGTILIAINPFKFLPIYNPKYVKMYDNHPLGKLEPHIYAIADVAYHAMLQCRKNQCIVISGESGSGKTQSTNFLIHHLTALSQKGFASGVEQIILGAGPVLEAFGNAKTAHNNNSSRFGKFIQVNYQETGTVRGAYVEKYLLEKSRLVYQEHNERNYHVFYYLLAGASEEEKKSFHLLEPEEYHYLNQMTQSPYRKTWDDYYYDSEPQDSFTVEGEDLKHDFERLQLAMEMVGFLPKTRKQIFSLLSAILHLGNIKYKRKTFRDDSIDICNPEVLPIVSELLEVKDEMLFEALTTRKTVTVGDRLILPYKLSEAVTVRDSMAKSLYSALFDWIVFRINHALLNNRNLEEHIKILSIGVLDIFGFEDYENNSFEQFCINFANERLQHYFNQHIFKLEQEEYRAEGISWHNIDYIDNSSCINLISKKPTGLLHLLDEECNFPQATNQTLLDKFKRQNEGNNYIEFPAVMEPAFIIKHYAGKVKYQVKDFREKNTDHMRPDIVALLKSSKNAFICSLIGIDPVAGFRWAVLRSYFRAAVAFREAGKRYVEKRPGHDDAVPLPVLKSVDSFSFLHHPVHQRSLEILQRCKEEKYSIARKSPRTPLSDLQGANTINEKSPRELHGMSWNGRTGVQAARLSSSHSLIDDEGIFLSSASSKLLERAHGILMRNRYSKSKPALPKHLLDVRTLKYIASMTLHDRITKSLLHLHKKKKPPSISAQFQASLNKLMETLGQAEPYFVKCIRSNAEKLPLRFNDHLVLRQLRYTGMLETVRIRQSGYSIKYSFQEFVDHFHVLLLQGTVPSQCSIQEFMREADLNPDNYQVGKTMIFTKESERQRLQSMLHTEVVRRIVLLQSWFRAVLERKLFLQMKRAAVVIQIYWQNYKMRQNLNETNHTVLNTAATSIQATWKSYQQRKTFVQMRAAATIIQRSWQQYWRRRLAALCLQIAWRRYRDMRAYRALRQIIIRFQAVSRGYLTRQRFRLLTEGKLGEQEKELEGENNGTLNACSLSQNLPEMTDQNDPSVNLKLIEQKKSSAPYVTNSNYLRTDMHFLERDLNETHPATKQSSVPHDQTEEFRPEYNDSSVDVLGSTSDFANSSSTVQGVLVRERPKSLSGDPDKQKVVRAKRHSRRMRELEQAIFSLELLKVRSGGVSPSEERRWSTEQTADSANSLSPQGTPDSESSRGSFEVPSCEDSEKRKESVSDEPTFESGLIDAQDILSTSPRQNDHALPTALTPNEDKVSSPSSPTDTNCLSINSTSPKLANNQSSFQQLNSEDRPTSPKPNNILPSCPRLVCSHSYLQMPNHLSSSHLPNDFFTTRTDHFDATVGSKTGVELEEGDKDLCLQPSLDESPHSELPAKAADELGDTVPEFGVLEKLEQLNVQQAERQKQKQQQNEKEMMDQIRQQKEILEKQRKVFERQEKDLFERQRGEALQKIEQNRQNDSPPISLSSPSRGGNKSQLFPVSHPEKKCEPNITSDLFQHPLLSLKCCTPEASENEGTSGQSRAKDRTISMFFETKGGFQESNKSDGWSPKISLEAREPAAGVERVRQPKAQKAIGGAREETTDATTNERINVLFFLPKTTLSKVDKDSTNLERCPAIPKEERASKQKIVKMSPLKGTDVARPAHKKKARMARTRSDFLTRAPNAEGEGETEEDEYDERSVELPHSPDQPSPELRPKNSAGLACYSDSEMIQSCRNEEQKKLHKAQSQDELGRPDTAQKSTPSDGRAPLKGRMRFWGNRKQGEKKVSREKLATQSEIQELSMDQGSSSTQWRKELKPSETSLSLQLPDVRENTCKGYDPIQHNLTPPRSPDLGLERGKEFKENKEPSPKVRRRRSVKISNVGLEPIHWQHDALQIITSANDFKSMNEFLQKKITDLETDDCKKDTFVDVVFKKSLKEFRLNIFNSYSTALAMDDGKSIRYKDLYALFEQILEKTLRQERRGWNESPVKVWVNTFKVFLDEFMTEYKTLENSTGKVPKVERKKRRKKESDIVEEYNGHVFKSTQYSIPTYCECCSSLIWMMDRAYVCKLCRYACHRKCCLKTTIKCSKKYDPELSSRQFGVEVSRLTNDERTVPLVAEKLINYIEMHGLYTEGIYRKSGSTNKIKELKQGLDTDISSMNLDEYSIHVIASVFKQWLRDLPNPLMTFELYDECLRAMGLQDRKEILRGVYSIIDQLSRSHLSTLERLIFHLVRIALQEDTNRMSSNALAIVFAPCILRCPDTTDPLQSVQDISKTTACVELIIVEQMNKYRARLKDINSLEFAENKAKNRLSLIRRSIKPVIIAVRFMSMTRSSIPPNATKKGKGRLRRSNYASPASPVSVRLPSVADVPEETNIEETTDIDMTEQQQAAMQQEERTLTEQIETLQKEKEELTFEMLALEPRASDDETLESEASIGTADSSENLNMDSEGAQSERSERSSVISSVSQQRAEAVSRLRRPLRKQADSVESIDSAVHSSASSSASSVPQGGRRFRFRSKSPSPAVYRSHVNCSPDGEARYSQGGKGLEDFPQFTSRGTFNPEKGKHKLKILKRSVQKPKDSPDGASGMGKKRNSEPEYGAPQQLVVFGKNEFMV
ncbi:LOW QUALITY PROTEIN: unconventional myosin-IXAa [Callorhinchus milii]|uniref:LOW QUALITY PROTEIN: unconventional myosin-IXAa n=1 Tax=Callorhinchus milii TaxID=7868 RepID=UPI001C3FC714|nr:LOW QUALITY PROTEIN: unconventional myosin-IXAa [Callorhinchus milii]